MPHLLQLIGNFLATGVQAAGQVANGPITNYWFTVRFHENLQLYFAFLHWFSQAVAEWFHIGRY